MKTIFFKWLLPRLLLKACDARISRSGKEGEKVNCYVVSFDRDSAPYFLANKINGDDVSGLEWDGNSYAVDTTVNIKDLNNLGLRITHFYGLSEVTYKNIYDVAWNYITRFIYLKIRLHRLIDSTCQFFFNKKKIVTKRRMDLLQFMIDDQLIRTHNGISSISLMSKIHSMKLFLHPSWEVQLKKMTLYLDSLVFSGELTETNGEYTVTGKAISTIEKYEEEERRHTEAVKIQKKILLLTIIAVVFAIVQTEVIKVPTIINFTDQPTQEVTNKD